MEALGELEDLAHDAFKLYPRLKPSDIRGVLVEASNRILPEVGAELGTSTVDYKLKYIGSWSIGRSAARRQLARRYAANVWRGTLSRRRAKEFH